jgi:hypothetical protein
LTITTKPFKFKTFCPNCENVLEVVGEWRTAKDDDGKLFYTTLNIPPATCLCMKVVGQCHICGIKDSEHSEEQTVKCIELYDQDPFTHRLTTDQMIEKGRQLRYY